MPQTRSDIGCVSWLRQQRPSCFRCTFHSFALINSRRLAGYIGEFEFVDNHRSGKIVVELNGRCAAVL